MQASRTSIFFLIFFAALVLCYPAFYNEFPLLFPDSAGYISMGFKNNLVMGRAWMYSGFVRHVSLWETPWLIIVGQGMLIAWLIYLMFKHFFDVPHRNFLFLVYILIVGSTTAISLHTSFIMADIFTPMVILGLCLLLFAKALRGWERFFVSLLFVYAITTHNSHFLLTFGLMMLLGIISLGKERRKRLQGWGLNKKKVAVVVVCMMSVPLINSTVNYAMCERFTPSTGGGIFLFARLCDFGLAQSYLNENCDQIDCKVCPYRQELGLSRKFLWAKNSVLMKTGSWSPENDIFYGDLCKEILAKPKYLKKFIIRSIESTLMQFTCVEYDKETIMPSNTWVNNHIITYFPSYEVAVNNSKQGRNVYDKTYFSWQNNVQNTILFLSFLLIIGLLYLPHYSSKQKAICLFLLLGMLVNAAITGSISGVYSRYQSRVAWLITLPAFWFVTDWIGQRLLQRNRSPFSK